MSKLLDYAKLVAREGETLEKEKEDEDAALKYIKVVDILLLLADAAPTYPDWTYYIEKAEFYQKKAKQLIVGASIKAEKLEGLQNEIPKPSRYSAR